MVKPWFAYPGAELYVATFAASISPAPWPGWAVKVVVVVPVVASVVVVVVPSLVAVFISNHLTWSLVHSGCAWYASAATPATTGAAIEVPDNRR